MPKKSKKPKHILRNIGNAEAPKFNKIEWAPQDKVTPLTDVIDEICLALGHKNVWYTDESRISDFFSTSWDFSAGEGPAEAMPEAGLEEDVRGGPWDPPPEETKAWAEAQNAAALAFAQKVLRVPIGRDDLLWEVAERVLEERKRGRN